MIAPDAQPNARPAIRAVAPYWGHLRDLIKALKYDGQAHNAVALGHLLFQHLNRHIDPRTVDLILPNPTEAHRGIRHTELLVAAMRHADDDRRWTFDDPADPTLVKVHATVRSHGQDSIGRRVAADALERALQIGHPERIAGKRILVIDDVVATASQIATVAKTLREHGAADVHGLVLAEARLPDPSVQGPGPTTTDTPRPQDAALGRLNALRTSHLAPLHRGPSL